MQKMEKFAKTVAKIWGILALKYDIWWQQF